MENKQTAVEWFKKQFYTYAESRGLDNDQWLIDEQDLNKLIEQAKAMQKEKIVQAFEDGDHNYFYSKKTGDDFQDGKEYYKEIYGN